MKEAERDMDSLERKAKKTDSTLKKSGQGMGTFGAGASKTSNSLKQLGGSLGVFNSKLGTSVSKVGGAQGALAGMAATMGGPLVAAAVAAGAAIATFAALSYQKAVQSQAEWAKFKGVVESAGQSFENSKNIVKDFAFQAGRSVGDVRTAFSQLTAAGINPSAQALRGVNEMAIGLRTDLTSAATAYTRIVKGGAGATRTLSKLGITMEEISTGGKVDTAKLNAILEQKFGKAADNFANTSEAAGARLSMAIDGLMVAFGSVLLGPATDLQNGLAYAVKGLTWFGGWIYNLFGGANAWSGAMEYLTPALNELRAALGEMFNTIMSVWGDGTGSSAGSLKPLLTMLGMSLSTFVRTLAFLIRVSAALGNAVISAARTIYNAGSSIWNAISSAGNAIRNAGSSLWNSLRNAASWIYNSIVNAIPKLSWPSPGQIGEWIRQMIWGSKGPGGIAGIGSQIAQQSALRAANLAAQRRALQTSYQSSPAAQSAASSATSNMGIFGSLSSFFGPGDWQSRIAGMTYTYQNYGGSRQKAWDGSSNCMTGNCVDMSLGVLNAAAQAGARGGSLRFGTWNGGPHVWAEVEGVTVDPARKALNGTFSAPPRGPAGGSGNTYVFQAPVYDWNAFKKHVMRANDNIVGGVF
jgi:hypothetical protein